MPNKINDDRGVNETRNNSKGAAPGRRPIVQQGGLSRNLTTDSHTTRHNPCSGQIIQLARKREWSIDMYQ